MHKSKRKRIMTQQTTRFARLLLPSETACRGGSITPSQALPADGCGGFLPEKCPDELTEAVLKFWQSTKGGTQ